MPKKFIKKEIIEKGKDDTALNEKLFLKLMRSG